MANINFFIDYCRDLKHDGTVADIQKQNLNQILNQVPEKGDFDLNNVLHSVYFFS